MLHLVLAAQIMENDMKTAASKKHPNDHAGSRIACFARAVIKTNSIFLMAAVLLLPACSDTINGKAVAEPEVVKFHDQLKAHEYESIYESSSPEFKSAIQKDKVVALFAAIDRKLGPLQEIKQVNWNVSTYNLKTTVVLAYQSRFQDGEATETFTFSVNGERAQLIAYNISSLDMLIK